MKLSTAALLIAFVAIPASVFFAFAGGAYAPLLVIILAPVALAIVGGSLAIMSIYRKEKPMWPSLLALLVTCGPALVLLAAYVHKKYDNYGYERRLHSTSFRIAPHSVRITSFVTDLPSRSTPNPSFERTPISMASRGSQVRHPPRSATLAAATQLQRSSTAPTTWCAGTETS